MIFTIVWPFIQREWRYIAIFALLAGLYFLIYNHGYRACEEAVAIAKEKGIKEEQVRSAEVLKVVQQDMHNQQEKNHQLQDKLDVELKKKRYTDCVITPGGVRIINKVAR